MNTTITDTILRKYFPLGGYFLDPISKKHEYIAYSANALKKL